MIMNPKVVMVSALAFTAVLVLVLSNYSRPPAREIYAAIVYDRSLSPRDPCESVKDLAEKSLSLAGTPRTKATVKVFATGDDATAFEPVVVELLPVPKKTGRVLEGKARFIEEQSKFVNDTYQRCTELPRTEKSPIFLAIKRAVEYLKASVGKGEAELYLFVQTDLEENVEATIKKAIRMSQGVKIELPKIDNAGVNVVICGYTETSGETTDTNGRARQLTRPRTALSADRLIEVWRSIFSDPSSVIFNPVCSAS